MVLCKALTNNFSELAYSFFEIIFAFGILNFCHCDLFVICDLGFKAEAKKFPVRSNWSLAASGGAEH